MRVPLAIPFISLCISHSVQAIPLIPGSLSALGLLRRSSAPSPAPAPAPVSQPIQNVPVSNSGPHTGSGNSPVALPDTTRRGLQPAEPGLQHEELYVRAAKANGLSTTESPASAAAAAAAEPEKRALNIRQSTSTSNKPQQQQSGTSASGTSSSSASAPTGTSSSSSSSTNPQQQKSGSFTPGWCGLHIRQVLWNTCMWFNHVDCVRLNHTISVFDAAQKLLTKEDHILTFDGVATVLVNTSLPMPLNVTQLGVVTGLNLLPGSPNRGNAWPVELSYNNVTFRNDDFGHCKVGAWENYLQNRDFDCGFACPPA